jgi:hypothetical protein
LERAWNLPAATVETRNRILRTVISEIVARLEGNKIHLVLHWRGGDGKRLGASREEGILRWTLGF